VSRNFASSRDSGAAADASEKAEGSVEEVLAEAEAPS